MPDLPPQPESVLDSLDDAFMRQQLEAELFGTAREGIWVDRFELQAKVGSGGMGSVWAARDHRLQRRVALKFLRSHLDGSVGEQRLFREAQALARLSHPNVVNVFDVGRDGGRVWIAMEHVRGQTVRQWCSAAPRSARELLQVWLAAGRGLAAIHAAGLLHRDIKPDNVLVGEDGRIRVIDFGLVRALASAHERPESEALAASEADGHSALERGESATEVHTRGFVGTLAYAAPEQRTGQPLDARADQYAFCVSLWESLYKERPATDSADPPVAPAGARVSRRSHRALLRGLASDPAQRFATMDALLAALTPNRGRWIAPTLVGVLALGVGAGSLLDDVAEAPDPCALTSAKFDELWTPERRTKLTTELPAALATQVGVELDAWGDRWRHAARDACEEVSVRHERSPAALDRRRACLDAALREFEILIDTVGEGEGEGEGEGASVFARWLAGLPAPEACLLPGVVDRSYAQVPPAQAEAVSELETALSHARFGTRERAQPLRLATAQELLVEARALDWAPLQAKAALTVAELSRALGEVASAREAYGELLDLARAQRDDAGLSDALDGLARVAMDLELDHERGRWAWERERAAVEGLGGDRSRAARLALSQGRLSQLRGDLVAAEAAMRIAVSAWAEAGSSHGWAEAAALRQLAAILDARGLSEEAAQHYARARALEQLAGPDPAPAVTQSSTHYEEGVNAYDAGRFELAEVKLLQALREAEALQSERGPQVGRAHLALSGLYDALGQPQASLLHARLAEQIAVDVSGPEHPARAEALTALGTAHFRVGAFAAAAAAYRLAMQIAEAKLEPNSFDLAIHRLNLAEALYGLERPSEAEPLAREATRALATALPPDHPVFALCHKILGGIALERGAAEQARTELRQALDIHLVSPGNLVERADVTELLARAELLAGDPAAARSYAEQARELFGELGPEWEQQRARLDTMLAQIPAPRGSAHLGG